MSVHLRHSGCQGAKSSTKLCQKMKGFFCISQNLGKAWLLALLLKIISWSRLSNTCKISSLSMVITEIHLKRLNTQLCITYVGEKTWVQRSPPRAAYLQVVKSTSRVWISLQIKGTEAEGDAETIGLADEVGAHLVPWVGVGEEWRLERPCGGSECPSTCCMQTRNSR